MTPVSTALRRRTEQTTEPAFDRLMRAAGVHFADKGFAAASLDAIAADAGVTKGSLYHHFGSKTELFEAVFEEQCRVTCEHVAAVVARKRDPLQAAYAGLSSFLEVSQTPAVQQIMLIDAPSVLGWQRVREIEAEYGLRLVRSAIEQLVAAGEVRGHDTETLSLLLFAATSEGAQVIARADNDPAARRKVERELRQLIDGLRSRS
jgi:AcrR family transcriptional regulator